VDVSLLLPSLPHHLGALDGSFFQISFSKWPLLPHSEQLLASYGILVPLAVFLGVFAATMTAFLISRRRRTLLSAVKRHSLACLALGQLVCRVDKTLNFEFRQSRCTPSQSLERMTWAEHSLMTHK
jgi:ABC-type Fe3+-siderophore transport system permease subunit